MTRLTATDRLRRLLAVIPWVLNRGEVPLIEISERFDYPIDRLRTDLTSVVNYVGVYPYSPDSMVEVSIDGEDDRVRFMLADYFSSPLRLTPEEALSLVSAGLGLLGTTVGEDSALERALEKLGALVGLRLGEELDVSLGRVPAATLDQLRSAVRDRCVVKLLYHSMHEAGTSDRLIEPHAVFSEAGEWYVQAWCRRSNGQRTFRADRILEIESLDETFDPHTATEISTFAPSEHDRRVTLELSPALAWVAEAFPAESVEVRDDGFQLVSLAASSDRWLDRLLVQLGPEARVVASEPELDRDSRSATARRILAKYAAN